MREEQKDKAAGEVLFIYPMKMEASSGLTIQDLISMIHSARYSKESGAFETEHFVLLASLKQTILNAEALYMAYDAHANYPYIDDNDQVWVFSEEEFSADAEDYYL